MKFSDKEKRVIEKLIDFSDEYYVSMIDFFSGVLDEDTAFVCYPLYSRTFFSYRIKSYKNNNNVLKQSYFDVVSIVNLFHKLEKESYISRIQRENEIFSETAFLVAHSKNRLITESPTNNPNEDKTSQYHIKLGDDENVVVSHDKWYLEGNKINGTREYKDEIYDSYIVSEQNGVYELLNSYVHINQEMYDLVEKDFKTCEEIQLEEAKKQTKWSIVAVILSLVAIIVSFIVPRCFSSKLDQQQFDTIQIKQNELILSLDELKLNKIDNDSFVKDLDKMQESIDEISNTLNKINIQNSNKKK